MRNFKKLTAVLMMILLVFGTVSAVSANTYLTLNGFTFYTNDDGEAVVVGYDDSSSRAEIPYSLLGAKVTEIAKNAFWNDSSLQEISFEQATELREIDSNAFYNCSALTSVAVPQLDELGFGAFQGCTELKYFSVKKGLTSVAAQAFYGCEKLEEVHLPSSLMLIDDYAFGNCASLERVSIPANVTCISEFAFDNCNKLEILCYENSEAHKYAKAHNIPFSFLEKVKNITFAKVVPETETVRFNGKAHSPSVTVTLGDITLKENIDYTIKYDKNTEAGKALIHIIGCGEYGGEQYAEFAIKNVLGDADGNGIVDVNDATCVQCRLAGMTVSLHECSDLAGNVTGSGVLSINDATNIQLWLAGKEIPYAVNSLMN